MTRRAVARKLKADREHNGGRLRGSFSRVDATRTERWSDVAMETIEPTDYIQEPDDLVVDAVRKQAGFILPE